MLRLFGLPRVENVATSTRLPRLAYVAAAMLDLSPHSLMSREALATLLWDRVADDRARANLRQLLARVRTWEMAAGVRLFDVSSDAISRGPGTLASDLRELRQAMVPTTAEDLARLVSLYAGELLENYPSEEGEAYFWIVARRTAMKDQFVRLALEGAQLVGGQPADEAFRWLEAIAPYDEAVARGRMVVAQREAGPDAARKVFVSLKTRLAADMSIEPEASTSSLLHELGGAPDSASNDNTSPHGNPVNVLAPGVPRVLILPPTTGMDELGRGQAMLLTSFVDEVIHSLARSRTFAVFGPHTARQLAVPAFPKGNPYGVDYLAALRVIGELGSGQTVLAVTLTRVATQEVLMSEEMVFSPATLSFNHYAMALSVSAHISRHIGATEMQLYRRTGAASAFVHYLLGNEYLSRFILQNVRAARNHYKQALKLAPHLSPARSMLARALCLEWLLLQRHDKELIDTSLRLARAALAEDPLDPMAHREVGHALLYIDQLDAGVEAFEDGVKLGPHHADLLFHYGDGLAHLGRLHEARAAIDKALSLNPLAPDLYHWVSATTDYFLGKYASASASLDRLKEKEPAARVIALVEAMNGNLAKAHRYRDIFMQSHPEFRLAGYSIPQRRKEDREHFLEGMRRAGFV